MEVRITQAASASASNVGGELSAECAARAEAGVVERIQMTFGAPTGRVGCASTPLDSA
jgi:hypothetical protein